MTDNATQLFSASLAPGILLRPLSWAAEPIINAIGCDPALMAGLLTLKPLHMHLIAAALAHSHDDLSTKTAAFLLRGPAQAILHNVFASPPQGIERALRILPDHVLAAESYRQLIALLGDAGTAKYLHHRDGIDEALLAGLAALPAPLRRPAILALFDRFESMQWFVKGLRFLSARAALPFDALVEELGSLKQREHVIARIGDILDSLDLPSALPPAIGAFTREDDPHAIRAIAKGWQNCLSHYIDSINGGTCAVYFVLDEGAPAVALVSRADRLGWALEQIKAPKNIDVEPQLQRQYELAFAAAGIAKMSDIAAIKDIVWTRRWARR